MSGRTVPVAVAVDAVARALAGAATLDDAHRIAARAIVDAEGRGRSEFGLGMLRAILDGVPSEDGGRPPRVLRDRPSRIDVSADDRYAPVVLGHAAKLAVERARVQGIAAVVVHGPRTLGQLGEYVRFVAEHGFVGLLTVGAPVMVAPYGAIAPALGTNPFAVALPTRSAPIVVDAVTSAVTKGRLDVHRRTGDDLPPGIAIDVDGVETLRPESVFAVLPRDATLLATLVSIGVEALSNGVAGITSVDPAVRAAVLIAFDDDPIDGRSPTEAVGDDLRSRIAAAGARVPGMSSSAAERIVLPDWLRAADPLG